MEDLQGQGSALRKRERTTPATRLGKPGHRESAEQSDEGNEDLFTCAVMNNGGLKPEATGYMQNEMPSINDKGAQLDQVNGLGKEKDREETAGASISASK